MMFAAQGILSGTQDMVLASGIESMTRVPMGSVATLFMKEGLGNYKSPRLEEKYPGIMFSQFMGAEMIVKKHGFTKDDLDAFALESRSEEHTSELQSLMRISYAVFCLKKKQTTNPVQTSQNIQ